MKRLFDGAQQELGLLPIQASTTQKIWLKISGVWKQVSLYLKLSGVWKAVTPYIKIGGVWK